jgi:hypothetical protein
MPAETSPSNAERVFSYRVLRYTPNLVRDEWANIGVLVWDPASGERRLRLIEDPNEYARIRHLYPYADESVLRRLRNDLEDRLAHAGELFNSQGNAGNETNRPSQDSQTTAGWLKLLEKWDNILSTSLQIAAPKGVYASDLDAETERVYAEQVAPPPGRTRVGAPGSRAAIRSYCTQVWKQARLWERIDKGLRTEDFTFPGDPMRLDYAYRRNGTRGFVQTVSVTRSPGDVKSLAYTVERIRHKVPASEFTAVTDIRLFPENARHRFVQETLRDAGVESVPMEGFAAWTAKVRPYIQ